MKSIAIKNLSKSYPAKELFEKVTFSINQGDRMALIGSNGVGKSTLLKIIAGVEEYDEGEVTNDRLSVAYIPQDFGGDINLSVKEYLTIHKASPKVFMILKSFGIVTEKMIETSFLSELSGGQKRVIEIATVLSKGPMFLCIDEPENHLDIKTRGILTELLKDYWGSVLFVSHDRYLINEVANKIISIENLKITVTSGKTYEEFMAERALKLDRSIDRWKAEHRAILKLEATVRELKRQLTMSDSKAKTYQAKKRELDERKTTLGKRPDTEFGVASIETNAVDSKNGKLIFSTDNLAFSHVDAKPLFEKVTVDVRFGQRIFLLGRNGTGKTSFLNILQGKLLPTVGTIRIGNNLNSKYIDQHNSLDETMSPMDLFYQLGFKEELARSIISGLLFSKNESEAVVAHLSGGQKQRLKFSLLFHSKPDFIILDEPTNNLDPVTWELLVDLINEFSGTVLIVTHDRSFIELIEEKIIWVLQKRGIKQSWGELGEVLRGM